MSCRDAFNERLQSEGSWVFACGLEGPSTSTVVDGTGNEIVTTDGPFAEAKEHLDAALALDAAGSKACQAPVEVRPLQGEEG